MTLSFGGFWAWDPVENASLISGLVIVAALYTMLVSKSTGHALRANFILVSLSFSLCCMQVSLTRSGILGDTSVHSFVVSGLENHLLLYLFVFTFTPVGLSFATGRRSLQKKEEATASREFWMFIGSLVLLFSALHVIFFTSIPCFQSPVRLDQQDHWNGYQDRFHGTGRSGPLLYQCADMGSHHHCGADGLRAVSAIQAVRYEEILAFADHFFRLDHSCYHLFCKSLGIHCSFGQAIFHYLTPGCCCCLCPPLQSWPTCSTSSQ